MSDEMLEAIEQFADKTGAALAELPNTPTLDRAMRAAFHLRDLAQVELESRDEERQ